MFIYQPPFVTQDRTRDSDTLKLDYLDELDKAEEIGIRSLIFKFALDEGLAKPKSENEVKLADTQDTGSWVWMMNFLNFRSLVDMSVYGRLMSALQGDDNYAINQVIDLHARLGMSHDVRVLNTIVDRVMSSIMIIPYDTSDSPNTITWERIHTETPFIWVLILMQAVIKSTAVKVGA